MNDPLPITPLVCHPRLLFHIIEGWGTTGGNEGTIISKNCIYESQAYFVDADDHWNAKKLYVLLMVAWRSPEFRDHLVDVNTQNRWSLFLQGERLSNMILDHLSFKLSRYQLIHSALDLLFIL